MKRAKAKHPACTWFKDQRTADLVLERLRGEEQQDVYAQAATFMQQEYVDWARKQKRDPFNRHSINLYNQTVSPDLPTRRYNHVSA